MVTDPPQSRIPPQMLACAGPEACQKQRRGQGPESSVQTLGEQEELEREGRDVRWSGFTLLQILVGSSSG